MDKEKFLRFYRKDKHLLLFTAALLALASAIALAVLTPDADTADTEPYENSSVYYSSTGSTSQGNASTSGENSKNIKNSVAGYTLRLYEDQIAIFENGVSEPLYVLDTPASRLPPADRILLMQGIEAETLSEARKLLEDYE